MCNTSKAKDFNVVISFGFQLCVDIMTLYIVGNVHTFHILTYNVYLHIPANIKSTISYNYKNRGKHTYSPQVQISGKNPKIFFRTKSSDLVTIGDWDLNY